MFNERLKKYRESKNLSKRELLKSSRLVRVTIILLKTGKETQVKTL